MAAVIEPMERQGEAPVAAGASLGAAADATRDALERAELAAAVQGAPGLGMVLQDAAAHVESPQPAVLGPGDDGGRLILAQGVAVPDAGTAPGAGIGGPDLAAMRRVAGLLGLAEAGRSTGEALGQHYLGEEGLAARRIGALVGREQVSPWSEQGRAIGEALGPPSLWSALRGEGQTEYANGLLSLKAGREVDFRTMEPAALADLIEAPWPDAAGIGRHAEALAAPEAPGTGVEGFPDQSDELRELGRPGGFGAGVPVDQGEVEGLPDQREEGEALARPGGFAPPDLPDTNVEGLPVLPEELRGPDVVTMERPYDPADVHIPPDRATHILDGDGPGKGGGHRAGTGKPNKTEFPAAWSDDKVLDAIREVARNGDVIGPAHRPDEVRVRGEVDGVTITAVIGSDGRVRTAYPNSGPGVVRNP